jgi:redox-sensing transcriptional repressor
VKIVTKSASRAIPLDTIRRLSVYLRTLNRLKDKGVATINSVELAEPLNFSSAQLRKDLSYFGRFGKAGVGYEVDKLSEKIHSILGTYRTWNVAVLGVGGLGTALLGYSGFQDFCAALDNDPRKIGKTVNGIPVRHINDLPQVTRECDIKTAILTVTKTEAQEVAQRAAACGIKAILNFAPVTLSLPKGIYVSNMDVSCELETLVCRLANSGENRGSKCL